MVLAVHEELYTCPAKTIVISVTMPVATAAQEST